MNKNDVLNVNVKMIYSTYVNLIEDFVNIKKIADKYHNGTLNIRKMYKLLYNADDITLIDFENMHMERISAAALIRRILSNEDTSISFIYDTNIDSIYECIDDIDKTVELKSDQYNITISRLNQIKPK